MADEFHPHQMRGVEDLCKEQCGLQPSDRLQQIPRNNR